MVNFKVTRPNLNIGDAVEITLPELRNSGDVFRLRLTYTTNEKQTATSWLKPTMTAGKKHPYLYTQCEDIACRAIAPMMDTPAVKMTYEARVIAPKELKVQMSANETGVFPFNQTHNLSKFLC